MSNIVIADSSCLIALGKIRRLEILAKVFGRILIPTAVFVEVVERGKGRAGSQEVRQANWIDCVTVQNILAVTTLPLNHLGAGESEAIVLAMEKFADFIILDDWKARQVALALSLPVIGTVAVLKKAEEKRVISDWLAILEELKAVGFRVSLENGPGETLETEFI
jgi:predicted nucleic acid-binding protein